MFPIDPSPYCFVLIGVFVFAPWVVGAFKLIEIMFEGRNQKRESPEFLKKKRELQRWKKITFISWISVFVFMAVTLFFMDAHDLLINHSKGIYGKGELK